MNAARHKIYTRKKGKPMRIMTLPPTDASLFLHVQRAHLHMILWKAADQPGPPTVDTEKFGWNVKDKTPSPAIAISPASPGLIGVIVVAGKQKAKPVAIQPVLVTKVKYLAVCTACVGVWMDVITLL